MARSFDILFMNINITKDHYPQNKVTAWHRNRVV